MGFTISSTLTNPVSSAGYLSWVIVVGMVFLLGIRLIALSILNGKSNLKPTSPQSSTETHLGVFLANNQELSTFCEKPLVSETPSSQDNSRSAR